MYSAPPPAATVTADLELVDGQLLERQGGVYDHSHLQGALIEWIGAYRREWNIRVLCSQQFRLSEACYRIPDVCILSRDQPIEPVFTSPPLVCIEILSKDDTLRSMQDRIDDYLRFGVPHIWLLDPTPRRAWVASAGKLQEPVNRVLEVPGTPIAIPLDTLFAELDD